MAKSDDLLGDYPIKAGTNVAILIHGLHHNDRMWNDPHTFNPARFLKDNFDPSLRRGAHVSGHVRQADRWTRDQNGRALKDIA